ncbi:MAG: saccharopine dehydrogenase NADP-binding domain-containing protein [Nitrincola sp.]|nr:saccharopine dehydrogenase NADP-binding domain-containing protein [Nitrincola sp.]
MKKNSLKVPGKLTGHALNALDIEATKALIRETDSQIVINVGSAFVNMSVLQACIETGAAIWIQQSMKTLLKSVKLPLGTTIMNGNVKRFVPKKGLPRF